MFQWHPIRWNPHKKSLGGRCCNHCTTPFLNSSVTNYNTWTFRDRDSATDTYRNYGTLRYVCVATKRECPVHRRGTTCYMTASSPLRWTRSALCPGRCCTTLHTALAFHCGFGSLKKVLKGCRLQGCLIAPAAIECLLSGGEASAGTSMGQFNNPRYHDTHLYNVVEGCGSEVEEAPFCSDVTGCYDKVV